MTGSYILLASKRNKHKSNSSLVIRIAATKQMVTEVATLHEAAATTY
jgi:hypothetical protein